MPPLPEDELFSSFFSLVYQKITDQSLSVVKHSM